TKNCDILITATGSPNLIKSDMVREGVVLIDCGISKISGKICGDIEKDVREKAALITPVPGGVGPVTVAMVLKNLLELTKIQEGFL
ncbi:MAG: bifunctional methylenetetrahydrofolate dehydrogenase/methenyltetrahydrofolate cyclohydrolase, partial [Candidatus Methanofastidiosia archaeon]